MTSLVRINPSSITALFDLTKLEGNDKDNDDNESDDNKI